MMLLNAGLRLVNFVITLCLWLLFSLVCGGYIHSQQPQTTFTAPQEVKLLNSKWTQGVGPGYWVYQTTAGLGITVTPGTVNSCYGTYTTFAGGTYTLANNATNYVYLDADNSCSVTVNTTGPTARDFLIGVYTTLAGVVTASKDGRLSNTTTTQIGGVNPQTGTTYTIVAKDFSKDVTFSNAATTTATLPNTLGSRFTFATQNFGAGTVNLTPSSGTINGLSSLPMPTGTGGWVFFDGTNWKAVIDALSFASISGSLACSQMPAGTGDVTWPAGSCTTTVANVPSAALPNVVTAGSCGDSTHSCGLTIDAKGRITAETNNTITGGVGGGSSSFFGLWSFTAPPSAGWTWDNQGSSTIDSTSGYEYASFTRASAVQMRLRYRTAPATPYTITAAILTDFSGAVDITGTASDAGIAIGFRDSTGKLEEILLLISGSVPQIVVDTWASSTSVSANPCVYGTANGIGEYIYRQPVLIQISDDGTNLKFRLSIDGNHWPTAFCSVSRTAQFASGPTQVFFGAYVNGAAVEAALVHWVATSP